MARTKMGAMLQQMAQAQAGAGAFSGAAAPFGKGGGGVATKHKAAARRMMAAKKAPLGAGDRFAALKDSIAARGNVRDPGAVAASIGAKKFGRARMQKMAAAGRKQ